MLRIARHSNHCIVPRDLPDPDAARLRLDAILRNELPLSCGRLLDHSLKSPGTELWFIREISLDLAVDLSAIGEQAAAEWLARRFARVLLRTIADGPDGENVYVFPNRAAYVERFIIDLVAGIAWDEWIYAGFDSLRLLPTGAAIRESLRREPGLIREVLTALYRDGLLPRVFTQLSQRDAALILEAIPTPAAKHQDMPTALDILQHHRAPSASAKDVLTSAVETAFNIPLPIIRAWLAYTNPAATPEEDDAEIITWLEAIEAHARATAPTVSLVDRRQLATSFGFVFLLLPHLETIETAHQRYAVLLDLCAAEFACFDPVLKLAAGLDADTAEPDPIDVRAEAEQILRAFTKRLIAFQQAPRDFLFANFFEGISHLQITSDEIDILLPRVPLRLVLRMGRFDDFTYTVTWLPGRTIRVRLPEEA